MCGFWCLTLWQLKVKIHTFINMHISLSLSLSLQLLGLLKSHYITKEWLGGVALEECLAELAHAVLMTLRLLLRDEKFQVHDIVLNIVYWSSVIPPPPHTHSHTHTHTHKQHVFMRPPSPLPSLTQAFSHYVRVNFSSPLSHSYIDNLLKELTSQ